MSLKSVKISIDDLLALLLSDIAAINSVAMLLEWGRRWAPEIKRAGLEEKVRPAYLARLEVLREKERVPGVPSVPGDTDRCYSQREYKIG